MNDQYVFCTKCGAKNPKGNRFCMKCGASLVSATALHDDSAYRQNIAASEQSMGSNNDGYAPTIFQSKNFWIWLVIGLFVIAVIGSAAYSQYQKRQREDIRSCVYSELNRDDFRVKIDQGNQEVHIIPESDESKTIMRYIADLDADGEGADEIDDSIQAISKKIDDKVGSDWTVALQNPDSSKRYFWIYKNGKCKYRIQDHAVRYDDDDDYDYYGDDYDFDDDY